MMKKFIALIILAGSSLLSYGQPLSSLLIPTDAASTASGVSEEGMSLKVLSGRKGRAGASYGIWSPSFADYSLMRLSGDFRVIDRLMVDVDVRGFIANNETEFTNEYGRVTGTARDKEFYAGAGVGVRLTDFLSVGCKAVLFQQTDGYMNARGFSADFSAACVFGGFKGEVGILNIGTPVVSEYGKLSLPSFINASGKYTWRRFTAAAEADLFLKDGFMCGGGVEYAPWGCFYLRAGYHYGYGKQALPSYASVGAGVLLRSFGFNFSYITASETLGNSALFEIFYDF